MEHDQVSLVAWINPEYRWAHTLVQSSVLVLKRGNTVAAAPFPASSADQPLTRPSLLTLSMFWANLPVTSRGTDFCPAHLSAWEITLAIAGNGRSAEEVQEGSRVSG